MVKTGKGVTCKYQLAWNLWLPVIFLVMGMGLGKTATAAIPQTERDVLLQLYTALDGDNWTTNTNWGGAPGTEGTWYGVTISTLPDGDHVTGLELFSNNLSGALPAAIGDLTNLQWLDLSSNQLTESIPAELGNLTNLYDLRLNGNQLTGSIPAELGSMTNLQYLYLSSNQLTGNIPSELGNLTNLMSLFLSSNQLTGSIPAELGNPIYLSFLHLDSNQLGGSIPAELGGLTILLSLNLYSNQLTGGIPAELENLTNLQELILSSNQLTGNIPVWLGSLSNLFDLDLSYNQLAGSIPTELGGLTNLQVLHLNSNILTDELPSTLMNLTTLGDIDLRWNGLHTNDIALSDFLDSRHYGGNWHSTQTVAPLDVIAEQVPGTERIRVSWTQASYTSPGHYSVYIATSPGGPYTFYSATTSKYNTRLDVSGLNPQIPYYFVVTTTTLAHAANANEVESDPSQEVESAFTIVGDVNLDDMVTQLDTVLLAQCLSGAMAIPPGVMLDCTGDGVVAVTDLTWLLNRINGNINPWTGELYGYDPLVGSLMIVPAGTYVQGSPLSEANRNADEVRFTHTLTKNLVIMATEVTQHMWADLQSTQPSVPADPTDLFWSSGVNSPVQNVTWYEAVLFANLLSNEEGLIPCYYTDAGFTSPVTSTNYTSGTIYCNFDTDGYRLPTEGEWEYSCRAGTTTAYYWGANMDETYCVYEGNSFGIAWFGGLTLPNYWDLSDMSGNVAEWCWDWYGTYPLNTATDFQGPASGLYRTLRGGSWGDPAEHCRSAYRGYNQPDTRGSLVGFRLCRVIN